MIYIYALICPKTNKIFYIGKTKNIEERFRNHLKCKDSNYKKNRIIKSLLNENLKPIFSILEETTKEEWINREKFYIEKYKKSLTNMTEGGDDPPINNRTKNIYQFNLDGKLIKVWNSIKEFCSYHNRKLAGIRYLCRHAGKFNGDYILMYEDLFIKHGFIPYKNKFKYSGSKYIYSVIDVNNKITEFRKLKEVSKFTGDPIRTICRYIDKNKRTRKSFLYRRRKRGQISHKKC